MPSRARTETGTFATKLAQEDVLDVVRTHPEPVVTVTDVLKRLEREGIDVVRETARSRLAALTDAGRLQRKEVGVRAVVWWIDDLEGGFEADGWTWGDGARHTTTDSDRTEPVEPITPIEPDRQQR